MAKTSPKIRSVEERFYSHINYANNGCHEWTGSTRPYGYGFFNLSPHNTRAHRIGYELVKGNIPKGLTIDHLCRNRKCVNPDHLEAVTMRVNVLRGETTAAANAIKTHCKRGHAFDKGNTYLHPDGGRVCRICHKEYEARRRKKQN